MSWYDPSSLLDARRLVLIQYAARLPARSPSFVWPATDLLVAIQAHLADDLLSSRWCDAGPTTYQKSFFKELLGRLEESVEKLNASLSEAEREDRELEVDEAVLEHYADLMSVGGSSSHNPFSSAPPPADRVTYIFPRQCSAAGTSSLQGKPSNNAAREDPGLLDGWCSVVLREEGAAISQGTTGLKTWEASLQLSRHLVSNPHLVSGSRVLELGSGVGLLGMVAGMLQDEGRGSAGAAGSLVMTDMEGVVLDRLRETLSSNGFSTISHIRAEPLNWLDVSSDLQDGSSDTSTRSEATSLILDDVRPQVILAADVVFDPCICPALADVLQLALTWPHRVGAQGDAKAGDPVAFVASTIRNLDTYEGFLSCLRQHDLILDDVPLSGSRPSRDSLPLFPSSHDVTTGGEVRLLGIRARGKAGD